MHDVRNILHFGRYVKHPYQEMVNGAARGCDDTGGRPAVKLDHTSLSHGGGGVIHDVSLRIPTSSNCASRRPAASSDATKRRLGGRQENALSQPPPTAW